MSHRYHSDGMRYRALRFLAINDDHPVIRSFEFSATYDGAVSQSVMDKETDRLVEHLLDNNVVL